MRFKVSAENKWKQAAQTSFCTVMLEHYAGVAMSKTHFWLEGVLKEICIF